MDYLMNLIFGVQLADILTRCSTILGHTLKTDYAYDSSVIRNLVFVVRINCALFSVARNII